MLGVVLGASLLAGCERPGDAPASRSGGTSPMSSMSPFPIGPLATADLLPYGRRYRADTGAVVVLERLAGPTLESSGALAFADPAFLRFFDEVPAARLTGRVACELGVFRFPRPDGSSGRSVSPATFAVGDVGAVERWEDALDAAGDRLAFNADAGTGIVFAVEAKAGLDRLEEDEVGPLFTRTHREGSVPVVLGGRTLGVMFGCGMGDGWYPLYLGHDAAGAVVAVAADLELHHRLAPVGS